MGGSGNLRDVENIGLDQNIHYIHIYVVSCSVIPVSYSQYFSFVLNVKIALQFLMERRGFAASSVRLIACN